LKYAWDLENEKKRGRRKEKYGSEKADEDCPGKKND